jgi:hypothetical protein
MQMGLRREIGYAIKMGTFFRGTSNHDGSDPTSPPP